jgi:hypothetical protein
LIGRSLCLLRIQGMQVERDEENCDANHQQSTGRDHHT